MRHRLPFLLGALVASGAAAWVWDRLKIAAAGPTTRSHAKPEETSKWEGEGGGVVDAEPSASEQVPVRRSDLGAT